MQSDYVEPMTSDPKKIQALLKTHFLAKWGFVIYRTTYASDADWERFLSVLNFRTRETLEFYGAIELMDSLDWSVRDDKAALDGKSVDEVREMFRQWQASEEAESERAAPVPSNAAWHLDEPRYLYCVHVDEAALRSVVETAPQPPENDRSAVGYVNLIDVSLSQGTEDNWMRVSVADLAPAVFAFLMTSNIWPLLYKKPPEVVTR